MRVDVLEGIIRLREVFSGVMLETEEGNAIGVCMRDDTFEISVMAKGRPDSERRWHRVNMQTGEIAAMGGG